MNNNWKKKLALIMGISLLGMHTVALSVPAQEAAPERFLQEAAEDSVAEEKAAENASVEDAADKAAGETAQSSVEGVLLEEIAEAPADGAFSGELRAPVRDDSGKVTWDCVWFGKYWQDDTNGDGKVDKSKDDKTPIKWRVLSVNNGQALLLSDCVLGYREYVKNDEVTVTWENSALRSYFNGYDGSQNADSKSYTGDGFLPRAFETSDEKGAILVATVKNPGTGSVSGGNDTQDKIFALSVPEVMNPSYGFSQSVSADAARIAGVTKNLKLDDKISGALDSTWYLRSPGNAADQVATVTSSGAVDLSGEYMTQDDICYRPALILNISKTGVFEYAGTVCSDGTVDENDNRGSGDSKKDDGSSSQGSGDSKKDDGSSSQGSGDKDEVKKPDTAVQALARKARTEGRGSAADTGTLVYGSGRYGLTASGNSAFITIAKGNSFLMDGGLRTSYASADTKCATVNQKGIVRTKKVSDGAYMYFVREADGATVTVKAAIINPRLMADPATGITAKKLTATLVTGREFDITADMPLNAAIVTEKMKKAELIENLALDVGTDGKLHITGKARAAGAVKLPLMINGTVFTAKLKIK